MSINLGLRKVVDNIIQDYNTLKSAEKVAIKYNTSATSIRYHLKKHNIICDGGNKKRNYLLPKIISEYKNNKHLFVSDILKKYKITKKYFLSILMRERLEIRNYNKSIFRSLAYYKLYREINTGLAIYNKRKRIKDVAIAYGLPHTGVISIFKHCGINIREKTISAKENFKKIIIEQLKTDYLSGMHLSELAKKYNTTKYYIRQALANHIKLRTKKEAVLLQNSRSEHQIKTIKNNFRKKYYTLPSGKIITVQGYEDDFLNFIFNKNLLLEEEVDFLPPRIPYGENRHYYPDFYIPKFNLIIEIKSSYTLKKTDPEKINAAKNSNYNFLIVVDKKYNEFVKLISHEASDKK